MSQALCGLLLLFLGLIAVLGEKYGDRPGFMGWLTGWLAQHLRSLGWSPRFYGWQALYLMGLVGAKIFQPREVIGHAAFPTVLWSVSLIVGAFIVWVMLFVSKTNLSLQIPTKKIYGLFQLFVITYLTLATW